MMRLLFLCLLLLLPAAAAYSEDNEGSGDNDTDDEDLVGVPLGGAYGPDSTADKTMAVDETSNEVTLIVIIVAVAAVTLSIAAIVSVILVRRHMNTRQQGIYSVPTEQNQKQTV